MRDAGKRLAEVIQILRDNLQIGVTTLELDRIAEEEIRKRQSIPAFKGYGGFPNTICASVNHAIVHGIPNDTPLVEGDLVSLDQGLIYGSYYADSAFSVYLGTPPPDVARLLEGTQAALAMGIEVCKPGHTISDVGSVIGRILHSYGLGNVVGYGGHGIGRELHQSPHIPNHGEPREEDPMLVAGMVICLEPMATLGTSKSRKLKDGWTVVTRDKSLAAHFEHTILITQTGPEVLTAPQST